MMIGGLTLKKNVGHNKILNQQTELRKRGTNSAPQTKQRSGGTKIQTSKRTMKAL